MTRNFQKFSAHVDTRVHHDIITTTTYTINQFSPLTQSSIFATQYGKNLRRILTEGFLTRPSFL